MESIPRRFIVHPSEAFEVFGVLGIRAMPIPQSLFYLFHFDFLLIRLRSLRIDLHHVLLKFFLLPFFVFLLELVVELRLDFRDAAIFDLLPKKQ